MPGEPTTAPNIGALYAALHRAQQAATGVAKDARNEYHQYDYASAEGMIAHASAAMAGTGLAVYCSGASLVVAADSGELTLHSTYTIAHESGATVTAESDCPVIPEKGRPADKALFGARTESLAYFLRDLLLIPRGHDAIPSARNDADYQPQQQDSCATLAKPAQPPAPAPTPDGYTPRDVLTHADRLYPGEPNKAAKWEALTGAARYASEGATDQIKELDSRQCHHVMQMLDAGEPCEYQP